MNPLEWIDSALHTRREAELLRQLTVRAGCQARSIVLDGQTLLNFGSNDYLGLAGEPRLQQAVRSRLPDSGFGSGASPLIAGRSNLHAELESALAAFMGTQAALLFPTGFAANLGTIPSLVSQSDHVFSDALNHASIIDGCRLSRASVHVYRHADMRHLSKLLAAAPASGRRLIVTDGLFSMDGDAAPLEDVTSLAAKYHAMVMVDEAHALGVWGPRGRGVAEQLGVETAVDVRVGTLSKSFGSSGGFVAGSAPLIHWLANAARSYVFSTAAPATTCAASLAALAIIRDEPERRTRLLDLAGLLREQLNRSAWKLGCSSGQIIPVIIGSASKTMQVTRALQERGLFVPGIRPPSVPDEGSRLRISLTAGHTAEDIQLLTDAMADPDLRAA